MDLNLHGNKRKYLVYDNPAACNFGWQAKSSKNLFYRQVVDDAVSTNLVTQIYGRWQSDEDIKCLMVEERIDVTFFSHVVLLAVGGGSAEEIQRFALSHPSLKSQPELGMWAVSSIISYLSILVGIGACAMLSDGSALPAGCACSRGGRDVSPYRVTQLYVVLRSTLHR